jgi:hypothetical protein
VLRVVLVEEMLHLTIAANLMNAIGGEVDLTRDGFLPAFPTRLPDGEDDFEVSLACFSPETLDTFLKIERPARAEEKQAPRRWSYRATEQRSELGTCLDSETDRFYSIGEFYEEIGEGFVELHREYGDALFCGDPALQVGSEYYYSGGGSLRPVLDLESALSSIELIKGQGEGHLGEPYDVQGELAHYYRFEQLKLGRYYQPGDTAGHPSGPECSVDWSAVYPTVTNPQIASFRVDPELYQTALAFNRSYVAFLGMLTKAFSGQPQRLMEEAVPYMFRLRDGANQLMRNPLPGSDVKASAAKDPVPGPAHAAPTFELKGVLG